MTPETLLWDFFASLAVSLPLAAAVVLGYSRRFRAFIRRLRGRPVLVPAE